MLRSLLGAEAAVLIMLMATGMLSLCHDANVHHTTAAAEGALRTVCATVRGNFNNSVVYRTCLTNGSSVFCTTLYVICTGK